MTEQDSVFRQDVEHPVNAAEAPKEINIRRTLLGYAPEETLLVMQGLVQHFEDALAKKDADIELLRARLQREREKTTALQAAVRLFESDRLSLEALLDKSMEAKLSERASSALNAATDRTVSFEGRLPDAVRAAHEPHNVVSFAEKRESGCKAFPSGQTMRQQGECGEAPLCVPTER